MGSFDEDEQVDNEVIETIHLYDTSRIPQGAVDVHFSIHMEDYWTIRPPTAYELREQAYTAERKTIVAELLSDMTQTVEQRTLRHIRRLVSQPAIDGAIRSGQKRALQERLRRKRDMDVRRAVEMTEVRL